jgi:hypothetical protein
MPRDELIDFLAKTAVALHHSLPLAVHEKAMTYDEAQQIATEMCNEIDRRLTRTPKT